MPDKIITSTTPCDCCGDTSECPCNLLLPPFGDPPYSDLASAQAALLRANCFTYADLIPADYQTDSNAAAFDGTTLTGQMVASRTGPGSILTAAIVRFTHGGGILTLTSTADREGTEVSFLVYGCGFEFVAVASGTAGAIPTDVVIADLPAGDYHLYLSFNILSTGAGLGIKTLTVNYSLADTGAYVIGPPLALWDDAGTTRQLEACPKNIIPRSGVAGTIGSWYTSESEAQDAIDNYTSNCVGAREPAYPVDSFTASGGSDLSFATSSSAGGSLGCYGGLNAEASETLTATFTGSVGTITGLFVVMDETGAIIYSSSFFGSPSPITSGALPYTGKYLVTIIVSTDAGAVPFDATAVISSSGTMSVNPIQALYDIGLDCPARLDCTP